MHWRIDVSGNLSPVRVHRLQAVGSIFEYVDGNAIFGVIQSDSPVWAPILLFMGVTGIPMSGE